MYGHGYHIHEAGLHARTHARTHTTTQSGELQGNRKLVWEIGTVVRNTGSKITVKQIQTTFGSSYRGFWETRGFEKSGFHYTSWGRNPVWTELAIFVLKLLSNMAYPHCAMLSWQFQEYSWVLVLFLDWVITIRNPWSSWSSTKICQKRHLFPWLHHHFALVADWSKRKHPRAVSLFFSLRSLARAEM